MEYPIIDAHQHFWRFDPVRDLWITDEMKGLQRDWLPEDIENIFRENQIAGSVVVQADPSENENDFLLDLADQYSFIKGVVGWIDLKSERIEERLKYYHQFSRMKGFRNLLQGENQRDSMLDPDFQRGISLLNKYGFSYDLLILPDQLEYAEKLVSTFPDQRFIIDHLAKPLIGKGIISDWKSDMEKFARYQNVYCKISGMVNEADWKYWEERDFRPYMDAVVETFGTRRLIFGSDWPVCLLAAGYDEVKRIASNYFSSFSISEQADFFGGNAQSFYKLS
ncbi:MAG TPA: amidohydrolase family protein [Puia sp.]|nr:amidohydrolase family protein [Puia sp.]